MTSVAFRPPPPAQLPRQSIGFARRTGLSMKSVGSFLPGLTAKAFEKFGFSTATLVTDWPAIAGKELAACSMPERLKWPPRHEGDAEGGSEQSRQRKGATLVLRVEGARALDVQYKSRQIIERINAYFGYSAVAELRLVQAPLPTGPQPRRESRKATPGAPRPEVAGIADAALRDALGRLGSHLQSAR